MSETKSMTDFEWNEKYCCIHCGYWFEPSSIDKTYNKKTDMAPCPHCKTPLKVGDPCLFQDISNPDSDMNGGLFAYCPGCGSDINETSMKRKTDEDEDADEYICICPACGHEAHSDVIP